MDKRREPRVAHGLKFIAHIHECLDDPGLEGESIECHAIDVSTHGIRLHTDKALVPNTLLNIVISIGDPPTQYKLRGEIRWTKIIDNNCHMGVVFSEEKGTDLDAWGAHIDRLSEV
ncbi:MAG: PilZ domain-containing protein [Proteobacteria bacterium]|nr:PilZ domain-containing protein [Pseudomonadota bacterium]